jgi:phage terminase large subunit GpA-like protein
VDLLRGRVTALGIERESRRLHYAPPPSVTLSQWADAYRMLSSESSAEPGKWRTDRAPFLREIMDAISDPTVERVTFQKPAQIGWTELIGNMVGYVVDVDPSPILALQPTVDLAKMWSKERFDPLLRDTPKLKGKIAYGNRREKDQSILRKTFPGGFIAMTGANSAAGLRSRPVRFLLCDEIDAYPQSAKGSAKVGGSGGEGDPLSLAEKRTTTFWNRKIVKGSTPTLRGFSRGGAGAAAGVRRRVSRPMPGVWLCTGVGVAKSAMGVGAARDGRVPLRRRTRRRTRRRMRRAHPTPV